MRSDGSSIRARVAAAICLATIAGGALDAWSYVGHGGVFANAQSGNIVIMMAELSTGQTFAAAGHSLSFVAFVAGLLLSSLGGRMLQERGWNSRTARLLVVAFLLAVLSAVADGLPDLYVAAAIGFAAAILITSLSHIGRWSFNTGMTTGNMRAAAKALADVTQGKREARPRLWLMIALCLSFALGAWLGAVATPRLHGGTALCAGVIVVGAALLLRSVPDPLPAWADLL